MRGIALYCIVFLIWYLGQCGFVFKNTATVYIDPVLLTEHYGADGNSNRLYPAPFAPEQVQANYVICTHNHSDHLAPNTIRGIAAGNPDTRFIVPAGCVADLQQLGIDDSRIIPINACQTLALPGISLQAVCAAHPVHQTDENGNHTALCFSLQMGGIQLLHPGDTYLTDQLIAELSMLPSPQLFFPPINGSDYFRTKRNCIGNLNPFEAAKLADILDADITIPTHFDMLMGNTADPIAFARTFMEVNPSRKWHIPALGERFLYQK
ncbi:MAG: MBL fold metallo-hydrolase [Clostridia bacterium]|nr:MBL fold metallo-hydrolase [Clostridia bacterium]